MSAANYQRVPTSDNYNELESSPSRPATYRTDPRFDRPTPPMWKRIALILFVVFLFWLSWSIKPSNNTQPKVIHATRYSKEHKYRPAASPIITERLKDGRVRLRGAHPSF